MRAVLLKAPGQLTVRWDLKIFLFALPWGLTYPPLEYDVHPPDPRKIINSYYSLSAFAAIPMQLMSTDSWQIFASATKGDINDANV